MTPVYVMMIIGHVIGWGLKAYLGWPKGLVPALVLGFILGTATGLVGQNLLESDNPAVWVRLIPGLPIAAALGGVGSLYCAAIVYFWPVGRTRGE